MVSSAVRRKDFVILLDFIERLKNGRDQIALDMDQIEKLTFIRLFYQYGDDMLLKLEDHVVPQLLENIRSCVIVKMTCSSYNHSESSTTMTEDRLVEFLDTLLVNLHYLPKSCAELIFPSLTQYELLQNVCCSLRDFHGLKVNGCIEHEIVEYVLPQFQLMAERVGDFYFDLLSLQLIDKIDETYELDEAEDSDITDEFYETDDSDEILLEVKSMLAHLLVKIIPIKLEDVIHHGKLFVLLERIGAQGVAFIKEEIRLVKEDLEFIRSFFGNVEQELNRELWTRVLDVAYEAEHAIKPMLVRDHGLLQLIFLLPDTIEKMKLLKDEVLEKISKNRGLIVANSPNEPVESNSSTKLIRKIIVGKTTLAYKVYNDKSVTSHFDIRAWCTVDKEYNRKKMLQKIYNQVTGSDAEFSEDFDVDDELRKKAVWKEDLQKRSRIVLTSGNKEVALLRKRHSDPLNLRLLRPEESWELLEKRVFGEESCPMN
ncbi:hypothetical protein RND71_008169 [Anisodus tanguticus]|uniref:NB-ARC domain-containing protein n=1 Tax=Anisodus tanguticus TaxID=243964 RepID=A0AAE1SN83_9SOLA|nr:hypothetical protein RND71_008169 [Anisodus tanguticus]